MPSSIRIGLLRGSLALAAVLTLFVADSPVPTAPPAPIPSEWLAAAQAHLLAAEYEVAAAGGDDFQAPNRAHGFRARFLADRVRLEPRTGLGAAWRWELRLVRAGRASAPYAPAAANPVHEGNRVEYRRDGLVEWYVNDARGLEQGFTFPTPPAGEPGDESLVVELASARDGELRLAESGRAIEWRDERGVPRVHYSGLLTLDARGRELPSRFSLAGAAGAIRIEVDARGAEFPVVIDPIATNPVWTVESNAGGAFFGWSASSAGDVNGDGYTDVILGAPGFDGGLPEEGKVFVYHGAAAGPSTTPSWTAESDNFAARFGTSATTAGDVNGDGYSDVIVGAPGFATTQVVGAAFVWLGSASGLGANGTPANADWTVRRDSLVNSLFGNTVAAAGDVNGDYFGDVVVSAPLDGNGTVRLYLGSPLGLAGRFTQELRSTFAGGQFGFGLATAGDVNLDGYSDVIVGAPLANNGLASQGVVSVHYGPFLSDATKLRTTINGPLANARLGRSVCAAGDPNGDGYPDVIAGAPGFDGGAGANSGAAFVYSGGASGAATSAMWDVYGGSGSRLGQSVCTAGDLNGDGYGDIVVGAPTFANGQVDEGVAYAWLGSPTFSSEMADPTTADWIREGSRANARFGETAALAGDVNGDGFSDMLIGSPYDTNGQTNEGSARIYLGGPLAMSATPAWSYSGGEVGGRLGASVASAGDLNGDGLGDIVVGEPSYGGSNEGRVAVFYGGVSGVPSTPSWQAVGDAFAFLGTSVGGAGDVNGDGYDDLIVGAPSIDAPGAVQGRVFVWHGSASGLGSGPVAALATANWSAAAGVARDLFGAVVGGAGDVNGDAFCDVIVGAPLMTETAGFTDEGLVFVWHGSASGLGANGTAANADWKARAEQASAQFGFSCGTAGDVNGDGYSDVIAGAPRYDLGGNTNSGAVFAWYGSASGLGANGLMSNADWSLFGIATDDSLGFSVGTAGERNGDGCSEVIIGIPGYGSGGLNNIGRVVTYAGSPGGIDEAVLTSSTGGPEEFRLGMFVGCAGDIGGDGLSEYFLGSPYLDSPEEDEGYVTVSYTGSVGTIPNNSFQGDAVSARLGAASSAGDVNADGFGDFLVGVPGFTVNGNMSAGQARLYLGGGVSGRRVLLRTWKVSSMSNIARLGRSDMHFGFRTAALSFTPFGRGRARPEVEVKPVGVALDGTGILTPAPRWFTVPYMHPSLYAISDITGLSPNTAYHYRRRLRYDPTQLPFQQHGRWVQPMFNARNESDVRTAATILVDAEAPLPGGALALRCSPNPLFGATSLRFALPSAMAAHLGVFDVQGRRVRALLRGERLEPGWQTVEWDGRDEDGRALSSGVYFLRLETEAGSAGERVVVLR